MINKFVTAVIVAAGNSTRMGLDISKQFIDLCGKTVIERTIDAFEKAEAIDEIVIVCRLQDMAKIKEITEKSNFIKVKSIAEGGATRGESVSSGVRAADIRCEYLAIHDGARPLVTPDDINRVVEKAFLHNATTLGVPVVDTVKVVDDKNVIISTPDRSTMYAVQTPQVFERGLYLCALELAEKEGLSLTDDCQLIERTGGKVMIVQGSYENIKITTKTDILTATAIIKHRNGEE